MHEFNIYALIAQKLGFGDHLSSDTISVFGSLTVLILLFIISIFAWRRLKDPEMRVVPSGKFTLSNIMEIFVEGLLSIMRGILGDHAERYLPIIGTLFVYIFCCNMLGFIPGLNSPTSVIVTNLACALVVFVYYNYVGIKDMGFAKYMKTFLGPVIWLAPLFLFIELISHFIRPITLSVRLYGNIMGDHMVLGIFSEITPIIVPIFFIILGIFVSLIQAFIFSILSTVYIALATQHE